MCDFGHFYQYSEHWKAIARVRPRIREMYFACQSADL